MGNYTQPADRHPNPQPEPVATMAGGAQKYRHLSRDSSARQALLRGLVTQLVQHEHIMTTTAKAKEASRMAEKLITLAKKDTPTTRRLAQAMLYDPHQHTTKLFGELKQRFMMAAKTVARDRLLGRPTTFVTTTNIKKATQFRGEKPFEEMVRRFMKMSTNEPDRPANAGMPSYEDRYPVQRENMGFIPKLAGFNVPPDAPSEPIKLAQKRYAAPFETESKQAAQAEAEAAADLGSQIVPENVQKASKK